VVVVLDLNNLMVILLLRCNLVKGLLLLHLVSMEDSNFSNNLELDLLLLLLVRVVRHLQEPMGWEA
jgi:hypothetical protein